MASKTFGEVDRQGTPGRETKIEARRVLVVMEKKERERRRQGVPYLCAHTVDRTEPLVGALRPSASTAPHLIRESRSAEVSVHR